MKRILITGANSFIGTSFEHYVKKNYPDRYIIDTLDMENVNWKEKDFSVYDSVFHVAGIAHSDNGKIPDEKKALYYSINTDLAVETALKAKSEGVNQFIFMSSIIVYGNCAPVGKEMVITRSTPVNPANCYGDSKLQAEISLNKLTDENFSVVILRPPMIYGKGCKGNYQVLAKLAKSLPFFPYVDNVRSMIFVNNLCEFVCLMIKNNESGIFYPQNESYSNTSEMVKLIADAHGKKILLVKGFTWVLRLMSHMFGIVNKAFGNMTYDMKLSEYKENYRVVGSLAETVVQSEGKI